MKYCEHCGNKRDAALTDQVSSFHEKYDHPIRFGPAVPNAVEVRFRLALIVEKFCELLAASIQEGPFEYLKSLRQKIQHQIKTGVIDIDLPAFIDALADLDYVIEGTRLVFGVDGAPIASEVHRANMAKIANGAHKPTKPADWTPPDIEGELRKQGWSG